MIALDTNILVYAHRSGAAQHRAAKGALETASRHEWGWGIALPSVGEFWRVVTHPQSSGGPSSPALAGSFLDAMYRAGAQVLIPGAGFASTLAATAIALDVSGSRIFDLQIALIARNAGADVIWTHDQRFFTVPGLEVEDPLT